MLRKIIHIDQETCNGCGICVNACHEGAIGLVDGKARLLRDDYCDGLGDCLPTCPTGAITFEEREAVAYDEAAVMQAMAAKAATNAAGASAPAADEPLACGCPGSMARQLHPSSNAVVTERPSCLQQWPVQIKLAPLSAPYFNGADLLIAADCTAFAYASMHERFIKGHITLVGCPKLDSIDYSDKLTQIIANNDIASISVVRMEVPCCGGIVNAVETAIRQSGKSIPYDVTVVSVEGTLQ